MVPACSAPSLPTPQRALRGAASQLRPRAGAWRPWPLDPRGGHTTSRPGGGPSSVRCLAAVWQHAPETDIAAAVPFQLRGQAQGPVPSLGGLTGRLGRGARGSGSEGRTRGGVRPRSAGQRLGGGPRPLRVSPLPASSPSREPFQRRPRLRPCHGAFSRGDVCRAPAPVTLGGDVAGAQPTLDARVYQPGLARHPRAAGHPPPCRPPLACSWGSRGCQLSVTQGGVPRGSWGRGPAKAPSPATGTAGSAAACTCQHQTLLSPRRGPGASQAPRREPVGGPRRTLLQCVGSDADSAEGPPRPAPLAAVPLCLPGMSPNTELRARAQPAPAPTAVPGRAAPSPDPLPCRAHAQEHRSEASRGRARAR